MAWLLKGARFEVQCGEAQLQVLERRQGGPETLAGAQGCGR
jgi:hypothetical protein